MKLDEWRPGDPDPAPAGPWLPERMPAEEELEDWPPGARACSLLLREHGINPWHVVGGRQDALDVDGWLRPTREIRDNDFVCERVPWQLPAAAVTEILDAFWRIDWTAVRPAPPPEPSRGDWIPGPGGNVIWSPQLRPGSEPLDALRQLAACGVSLRPPYPEDARREAETVLRIARDEAAAAARRAGRRFWFWMALYGVSAVFLGWQLRGFLP